MGWFRSSKPAPPLDPLAADFLKKKESRKPLSQSPLPNTGDLAPSSIFADERKEPSGGDHPSPTTVPGVASPSDATIRRNPEFMAAALDPQPMLRKRWERKMLIRDTRRRDRLSKTRKLLKTERFSLSKSHFFKTSVKKLGMLARQVAGKPVEEAIVQMRFSKKKAAQDVLKQLEYARDEAIVRKGMGLKGLPNGPSASEKEFKEGNIIDEDSGNPISSEDSKELNAGPINIRDKDGKKRKVHHKTQIYVDQAWVGRGTYGQLPDHRARGQINVMRTPYTSA